MRWWWQSQFAVVGIWDRLNLGFSWFRLFLRWFGCGDGPGMGWGWSEEGWSWSPWQWGRIPPLKMPLLQRVFSASIHARHRWPHVLCSIAVMLLSSCLHRLHKVVQPAFSYFPTLWGWLALQGSPRALQHQGPGAGQAANRRTDREDRTLAAISGHQQGNPGHRTANYFEQNALFFMSWCWVLVPNYK